MEDKEASRYHKRIRLDAQYYAQPGNICSVTAAAQARRPIFADPDLARIAVDVLRSHSAKTGVSVHGYCVMPDHVHLVIEPSSSCDVIAFVGQYKNLAQRALWQHGLRGLFWQKSFWDHFLRGDEQLEQVLRYVLNNPVRRGLVEQWEHYPYSGSLVWDL